ncbi:MAG: hypothetical protein A2W91_09795 [Bacteroidetes bacterium GWF2_38_335]|nr:MAG: hypothetical protein A2W91_09795 [Bacteroidetes bacterium GWF2_38_335]OFY81113.1 MAG: hypothetical protein A2281_14150 [Bacteroidetes bacterium RIFOXYA12_FULL_38_20]HBS86625.1 S9 family peptidase [Bacteroidales bacterium]
MKTVSFILLILLSLSLFAQDSKMVLESAMAKQWQYLFPGYKFNFGWRGNTDNFTEAKGYDLMEFSASSSKEKVLLTFDDLNKPVVAAGLDPLSYFPEFTWRNDNEIEFIHDSHFISFDVSTKKITLDIPFDKNASKVYDDTEPLADFCYANKMLAYSLDNNLYITFNGGKVKQITKDEKGILNGQIVHRNEFGINKGTFWSPNGKYLAFYRMDETMVTEYPLVDMTARISQLKNIRYPMAGMKSHEVTLGVYDVASGKTIFLETGEPKEQYLTNIAWSPDDKYIYIAVLNRGQNHMKLNKYDAVTGKFVKTLFEEKNDRYVEPENPMIFLKNKPDEFLWLSERDGYKHFYHYDSEGNLKGQLTKGEWMVTEFLGFDKTGNSIFFMSTEKSPIENHAYKLDLLTKTRTQITKTDGNHTVKVNYNGTMVLDNYSNYTTPNAFQVMGTDGKVKKEIAKLEDPFKKEGLKISQPEVVELLSGDGKTKLYARIIKPLDFDPAKKYPAIVYVYGGPHAQLVSNTWMAGAGVWDLFMAQEGYVMLTIDNRGSSNRGFEFESIIHRRLGVAEMADQMKGIEYLQSLGFVDMERIGVHGWSYGGFLTTNLMLNFDKTFKVGVAGGPVCDWKYYEIMYGERYMDTPEENPEGYTNACLTKQTKKLKGKLLMIHGYIDNVVVMQHSLDFLKEAISNSVQVDYFVYPTHEHNVRGKDRIHLMRKVTNYFNDYLK